jgi:pimeloyl-ACP methyl ester carboxylesterase
VAVDEHTIELAGGPVFYRSAPAEGPCPLYLHSVPTSADDWTEFLELSGGLAVDLLGFGRSSKAGNLKYTLPAYTDFVETFLRATDTGSVALVGHGWGAAVGLAFAQRHPERVETIVLIDAIPLLEGFRWPSIAQWWRRWGFGELIMGSVNHRWLARTLRSGAASPQAWTDEHVAAVYDQFDQGTQRAILRLHRSIDVFGLSAAGADLSELWAPTLVLWGERDPWLDPAFGEAYARRLPRARFEPVPGAGHWPWLDQPGLVERVTGFLSENR